MEVGSAGAPVRDSSERIGDEYVLSARIDQADSLLVDRDQQMLRELRITGLLWSV